MKQRNKTTLSAWAQPALLSLAVAVGIVQAAPGDLDTTFAGKGWTSADIGSIKDAKNNAYDVIVQSDGKIVTVGADNNGTNDDLALTRFNSNGATLDTTFSGDGRVTLALGNGDDTGYSVIQQGDGKIVVAGTTTVSRNGIDDNDLLVARYNADGSLDTGFGVGGVVTTDVNNARDDVARDIIQQADGKLVVVGMSTFANNDIIAVRYNSNGSLDTTFDTDGKVNINVLAGDDDGASVIQQTDGKLVIGGSAIAGIDTDLALVRLTSTGALDTSFDTDGKVTKGVGTLVSNPSSAVTISVANPGVITWTSHGLAANTPLTFTTTGTLPTGLSTGTTYYVKTVLTGNTFSVSTTPGGAAVATTTAGSGTHTATATVNTTCNDRGYSVLQQTDGKLVIAGDVSNDTYTDFVAVRFSNTGAIDTAFGTSGVARTAIGTRNETAYSIVQQTDGKLVAAGFAYTTNNDFALVRYTTTGSLDTTFSGDGIQTTLVNAGNDLAYALALQTDGKLVAAGLTRFGTTDDLGIARYNTDGALDTTFGTGGKTTLQGGSTESLASAITQQADGKLVVTGYANVTNNGRDVAVARYNADGSLDTSFSADGSETTNYGSNVNDYANTVIQQADGKIVIAGYREPAASNFDIILARYTTAGVLDTTFGSSGKYLTGINSFHDVINDVIQLPDGKLLAAGYINSSTAAATSSDFGLMRFTTTGSRDNSFNGIGSKSINISQLVFGSTNRDQAQSLILDNTGKIVVVGAVNNSADYDIVITRHLADGSLDATFSSDGITSTDIAVSDDYAYDVKQDANGRYVVAGMANISGNDNFVVLRYNNDGTLDTTFGGGTGYTQVDIGGDVDSAYSLTIEPDGKIAVAGYSVVNTMKRPSMIHLLADGTLDTSFGTGGKKSIAMEKHTNARGMVVQKDGKYALAGNIVGPVNMAVLRLTTTDTDADGFGDAYDNCPVNANTDQLNTDGDAQGDACDPDDDNDGLADGGDNCPVIGNADQANNDGDAQGDVCDTDDDNDTVLDGADNCPMAANTNQANNDADSQGDTCDADDDNDGFPDVSDVFPFDAAEHADTDGDGVGDNGDNCPVTANAGQSNFDGDTQGDVCDNDDDNDGVADGSDLFPFNPAESIDSDSDGTGNNADPDDDNDGTPDVSDAFPLDAAESLDTDGDGIGNNADGDDDGDGAADTVDTDPLNAAVSTEIHLPLNSNFDGSKVKDSQSKK